MGGYAHDFIIYQLGETSKNKKNIIFHKKPAI